MKPFDEEARLDALYQLNLLDTPANEAFDRITRMAAQIFDLPVAAVSLTDRDRQWFKSRVGVDHRSIPREKAPCGAVAELSEMLVVPDLLDDPCYANSHLADTGVRFYAGAPLITRDGFGLGALCVLGTEPRTATKAELDTLEDLAKIVMAQIELQHAFGRIDPVSGFPNRTQFLEDVSDLQRDHPGESRIVVLVDLARNHEIDHGMRVIGPSYIDHVVREGARLLRGMLQPDQPAYHVAATQFAFLAPAQGNEAALVEQLVHLVELFKERCAPLFVISTVLGVAPLPTGETSASDALRSANGAAQDARGAGQSVSLYSTSKDCLYRRSFTLLNDFGAALEQPGQLRLVFQPRVQLASGKCVGAEALLRWRHPELGDVSPAEFIPIIEQTALAKPTTEWVLNHALTQLSAWAGAGLACQVSINVSATNLEEPGFVDFAALALREHAIAAALLEMEITESAAMANTSQTLETLIGLRAIGITLAIDDFGSGYSSLAYLQRLPTTVLKIDQSFVRDLTGAKRRAVALLRSMVALSHEMGYRVVAEGVETREAAVILRDLGCEEAQGYLFARPLEASDFEQVLRGNRVFDHLLGVAA